MARSSSDTIFNLALLLVGAWVLFSLYKSGALNQFVFQFAQAFPNSGLGHSNAAPTQANVGPMMTNGQFLSGGGDPMGYQQAPDYNTLSDGTSATYTADNNWGGWGS